MGKIKTRKSLMKRLNVRQSGSISTGHPGFNHKTGKKNAKFNRRKRTPGVISHADNERLKNVIVK